MRRSSDASISSRVFEVEIKIRAAVAQAKAKGWRIIKNAYLCRPNGCCVLGACVIDEIEYASDKALVPDRAASFLGIRPRDAVDIAAGLDWNGLSRLDVVEDNGQIRSCNDAFRLLGHRLKELVDP